ncbi:MAG: ankyrin repeat domain-containing protein [Candidatus Cardinium sp.]|nr:ankyrin repeat domain-containing protein [Candidatus Cardinium sp.]
MRRRLLYTICLLIQMVKRPLLLVMVCCWMQAGSCQRTNATASTRLTLKEAVKEGNINKFNICLEAKPALTEPDSDGNTLLHWACGDTKSTMGNEKATQDRIAIIEKLLRGGIDINAAGYNGWTALHFAVNEACKKTYEEVEAYIKVINVLLKEGAIKNCKDIHGYTPLYYAYTMDNQDQKISTFLKNKKATL